MPSSPRGVRLLSGQEKRTWLYRQPRADVGIGPYKISIIVFLLCNPRRFFFFHSSFISCGDLIAIASPKG